MHYGLSAEWDIDELYQINNIYVIANVVIVFYLFLDSMSCPSMIFEVTPTETLKNMCNQYFKTLRLFHESIILILAILDFQTC